MINSEKLSNAGTYPSEELDLSGCVLPTIGTELLPKTSLTTSNDLVTAKELDQIEEADLEKAQSLKGKAVILAGAGFGLAAVGLALSKRRILSAGILVGALGVDLGIASAIFTQTGHEAGNKSDKLTDRATLVRLK